jgi:hypothetical protein
MSENKDKKEKKTQKTTLPEFHAWLSGVEEMQEEGWTPTPVQWKKIREKIFSIEIVPVTAVAPISHYGNNHVPVPAPAYEHRPPQPPLPAQILSPDAPMQTTAEAKVKTPDIDSSSGEYKSAFE